MLSFRDLVNICLCTNGTFGFSSCGWEPFIVVDIVVDVGVVTDVVFGQTTAGKTKDIPNQLRLMLFCSSPSALQQFSVAP